MRILIACEESQTVCKLFRAMGHEAFSCDILPCSGGHPEWHIQRDLKDVLEEWWDMIIAFPPCTFLTTTANRWMKEDLNLKMFSPTGKARERKRKEAIEFFMMIANANCPKIAIENPVGIMSTEWRKPDQIIQPYYFGDPEPKRTCLWLKGLPKLYWTDQDTLFDKKTSVPQEEYHVTKSGKRMPKWYAFTSKAKGQSGRAKIRSKTFQGIAQAMANSWG